MEAWGFSELADQMERAGYRGNWITEYMIETVRPDALDFPVRGLDTFAGEQLVIEFHYRFSGVVILLEKLDVHLLNGPVREDDIYGMTPENLRSRWQATSISYGELVPFKQAFEELTAKREQTDQHQLTNNAKNMNVNNLENLREEMKALGFKENLIAQMEEQMKKNVPDFRLHDTMPATRGQVDLTLHFRQSGKSEFYYLNKFEAAHNQGKRLEEGQKYLIITPGIDGKNMVRKIENLGEAIDFFRKQEGNSELAIGKDAAHRTKVAGSENGKVNYVAKDFERTFYSRPLAQTFWVEHGKGFTAEQAANLVQGRSVYRDDLLNVGGTPYKAWMKLDMDKPRDRHNNLNFNQYHDPAYGFDLGKTLDRFNIRELEDPAKRKALETSIKGGNRPMVTVMRGDQEVKLLVEAIPRYSQLNMYTKNGKPEKREQFLKQPMISNSISKEKELSEGLSIKK